MEFARQSILDTIGKGRYHSCVMTSYSFDFQFFELKVMRALRNAGVKNILVLLDGYFLEHLASQASGREFTLGAGFSISPVYVEQGVFHPKMTLLFGPKEGALFVGSGNLTSAGLGNNDEAWGCFHLNEPSAVAAPLFADAWDYVQRITQSLPGMAAQKMHWIREFTPWLSGLPRPQPGTLHDLESDRSIALLTNQDRSILPQLLTLLAAQQVQAITSISPYYDKAGAVLRQLQEAFPAAKITCVIEERAGALPTKLDATAAAAVRFYQWSNCAPRQHETASRLHAKLLHFTTTQGEYLLVGSANTTASGLGTKKHKAVNEEVSLLLHRPRGNYLRDLGLKFASAGALSFTDLQQLPQPHYVSQANEALGPASRLPVTLTLAELEAGVLTLHIARPPAGRYELQLVNYREVVVFVASAITLTAVTTCTVSSALTFGTVCLVELRDQAHQLVGKQFVQFPTEQTKFSPDPKLEKLQKAFVDIEHAGFEYFAELWDLIQLDEPELEVTASTKGLPIVKQPVPAKAYQKLSYEEFNATTPHELLRQKSLLGTAATRIDEFLALVGHQLTLTGQPHDYRDSAEQGMDSEDGSDEQSLTTDADGIAQPAHTAAVLRERKSIDRFIVRVLKYQTQQLRAFATAYSPHEIDLPKLTLKDLSVMNVALYVALHYTGRPFTYHEHGQEYRDYYLYKSGELQYRDSLKGFCHLLVGSFLLLATAGITHYQDPAVQQRLEASQRSILERIVFFITQISWKKSEEVIRDLLLFNALHYLRPEGCSLPQLAVQCQDALGPLSERALFAVPQGPARLQQFFAAYSPRLTALKRTLQLPATERPTRKVTTLQPGDWIYSSKLGICVVQGKLTKAANHTLTLMRPGLQLETEDYCRIFDLTLPATASLLTV